MVVYSSHKTYKYPYWIITIKYLQKFTWWPLIYCKKKCLANIATLWITTFGFRHFSNFNNHVYGGKIVSVVRKNLKCTLQTKSGIWCHIIITHNQRRRVDRMFDGCIINRCCNLKMRCCKTIHHYQQRDRIIPVYLRNWCPFSCIEKCYESN